VFVFRVRSDASRCALKESIMLTFLFLTGLSATIVLLMAAAADEVVVRGRQLRERPAPMPVATGALVSISLARAGGVRVAYPSKAPDREPRKAA
jgi:hypothetical protein